MNIKNINNLNQLFFEKYSSLKDKNEILLTNLKEPKKSYSWSEVFKSINILSTELSKFVTKGDRCLLISENRPEWFISDMSIMLSQAITVPAYTTYIEKDYEYIIDDCSPSVIFVSNDEQFNKIKNIVKKKNFIKKIFSFEKIEDLDPKNYVNINNLIIQTKDINFNLASNLNRKDVACIIYTSGTQGNPKGVMLTHHNLAWTVEGASEVVGGLGPDVRKNS